jgi:type IV secretion system protein VirD4
MYRFSRVCLIGAVVLTLYSVAVGLASISPILLLAAAAVVAVMCAKKAIQLTAFGTARWCDESDMRRAGMIGANRGLILGRSDGKAKGRMWDLVRKLFNPRVSAAEACEGFLKAMRRKKGKEPGEIVRLPQAVHTAVFAPTGVGKNVSCILPFLLTCPESCVVVDFKGENALLTAEHRRRMGHDVVILDPYKVVTQ